MKYLLVLIFGALVGFYYSQGIKSKIKFPRVSISTSKTIAAPQIKCSEKTKTAIYKKIDLNNVKVNESEHENKKENCSDKLGPFINLKRKYDKEIKKVNDHVDELYPAIRTINSDEVKSDAFESMFSNIRESKHFISYTSFRAGKKIIPVVLTITYYDGQNFEKDPFETLEEKSSLCWLAEVIFPEVNLYNWKSSSHCQEGLAFKDNKYWMEISNIYSDYKLSKFASFFMISLPENRIGKLNILLSDNKTWIEDVRLDWKPIGTIELDNVRSEIKRFIGN